LTDYRRRLPDRDFEEIRHTQDLDTVVSAQPQQILISTHDVIRPRRDRAFENPVIWGIFLDYLKLNRRPRRPRHGGNPFPGIRDILRHPVELPGEYALDLIENGL